MKESSVAWTIRHLGGGGIFQPPPPCFSYRNLWEIGKKNIYIHIYMDILREELEILKIYVQLKLKLLASDKFVFPFSKTEYMVYFSLWMLRYGCGSHSPAEQLIENAGEKKNTG